MRVYKKKRRYLTEKVNFEIILESYYKLLEPHEDWSNSGGEIANLRAKDALLIFYDDYINRQVDQNYIACQGFNYHYSFLDDLCLLRDLLRKQRYREVCWELRSLMHHELIFQKRIHNSLKQLLKDELMEAK